MGYNQFQSYNMSTVTIQMVTENDEALKAAEEVKELLISIEKKMSFYLKSSEVSQINKMSGIGKVKVSNSTFKVIEESIKYSKLTGGLFDITLAPVISEWGIFSENEKVPEMSKVKELLNLVGYENIILDKENSMVGLKKIGQKIDLGGIAKGYATDMAVEVYKKHNVKSAMINVGGNVSVLGRKDNNELWAVGIQNPEKPRGEIIAAVRCEDTSVVTSGNYVRFFEDGNNKYGHIFNSENGIPINNDLLSVTIICRNGLRADAISTAVFAQGSERGISFIKENKDISGILITANKIIYVSKEIKKQLYIMDNCEFEYKFF